MIKTLFWNVWGHRVPAGIHEHLTKVGADINCLTEVTSMGYPYDPVPLVHTSTNPAEPPSAINGCDQLAIAFKDNYEKHYHTPRFESWECKVSGATYRDVGFGSALLYRPELAVIEKDSITLALNEERWRVLQYLVLHHEGERTIVAHLHGVWIPENTKGDDPLRIAQSKLVLEHLATLAEQHETSRIVFGGDLNLNHNTDALAQLENGFDGMPLRNLIREYAVTNTRTPAYRRFYEDDASRYADYVFVSPEIQVHQFFVDTSILASDHAPLLITFS